MRSPALASAFVALAGCAGSACAAGPLAHPASAPAQAAALPVFAMEQSHPVVAEAMGPMKSYACLSEDQASTIDKALNGLRSRAAAKGADALVDYHYTIRAGSPRAPQCQHFVEAEAVAVVLDRGSRG